MINKSIAVFYICRHGDKNWHKLAESFVTSYKKFKSGIRHQLYIIFKGFNSNTSLNRANKIFTHLKYKAIEQNDEGFDIGSYYQAALLAREVYICPLNSYSNILCNNWLKNLYLNICQINVGLVGATGSYEKNDHFNFLKFPNPHIRTNAFLINRQIFIKFTSQFSFLKKNDVLKYESGRNSLTNFIRKDGKKALVIGRNGRAFDISTWPLSRTFKSSNQENLLVSDNQTDFYLKSPWPIKNFLSLRSWGKFLVS